MTALTHLLVVHLRPGVQSITVQYQVAGSGIWIPWNEGNRIIQGATVRFTVTTYPNFTLTSWKAYYADEYDDTVDLTLSPISGQSAWEFTMPPAGPVEIRCEATSDITGSLTYQNAQSDCEEYTTPASIVGCASAIECINKCYELMGNTRRVSSLGSTARSLIGQYENNGVFLMSICESTDECYVYGFTDNAVGASLSSRNGTVWDISGEATFRTSAVEYGIYSFNNGVFELVSYRSITRNPTRRIDSSGYIPRYQGADASGVTRWWRRVYAVAINATKVEGEDKGTIRYIMSPEDSGELDASAPSEFVQGTTEFTFKWRIKAAYEFRRLTPFAVGEGSLEDDVVHSLEYDGDTRTYTFTVQQIPDWAKGVRVLIETIMTDDPSNPIGDNGSDGPIGGDGTFDDSSDEVPLPAIPEGVSAADTGFVTLFRPTINQLRNMSDYMWSNLSEFIENLQKIFTNPMDYIISLASFPVTPNVGPERAIKIGNFLSNITMPPIIRQFYEFNCGIVTIPKYFGSFLDYAPNTKARIMLPFIGDADLSINEIMGKTLHLWYRIDLLSGSCVAVLTIDNSVYYQWAGNCSISIPVTASDFSRIYAGIARVGVTAAAVAGGGLYLGAAASAASRWNTANSGWHSYGDIDQGFTAPPNFGVPGLPSHHGQLSTEFAEDRGPRLDMGNFMSYTPPLDIPSKRSRAVAAAAGGAFVGNNIMNAIPRVQHAGGMSGNIGIMGNRTPFIVLEYPNVSMPENYKHVFGYPSNMYKVLGNLAGYTKCKQVLFESTKATDDEYEMVISALKGGVYL